MSVLWSNEDGRRFERKPVYVPKWGAILAAMAVIGALLFMGWKIIEALPRFIEAWR